MFVCFCLTSFTPPHPGRAMGLSRRSSKALGFVIDTTESMNDDIAEVNSAASAIIDSEVGTENEPSVYMLVAFNDPGRSPNESTVRVRARDEIDSQTLLLFG